nr:glutamate receptor 2.8-like [Tanacetum cinerariifolium]
MGYSFYYPPENKVFVARNAKFIENSLITQETSGSLEDLKIVQEEDTHPSENTSLHNDEGDQEIDEPESDIIPICRSTRAQHAPDRMCLYIDDEEHELGDLNEPDNYKAALLDPESDKWLDAMNVELQSMKDNEVWDLVNLPPNGKTAGSKWLFKKKTDMDGVVHTYNARLVAKGFTQTYEVYYGETFSLVIDIRAIRILIAIDAFYDDEIWQMDVKTTFLNGHLSEEVYMVQPEEQALQDFYQSHNDYTTRLVPHFRDSKSDRVQAAAAAIQLLKDVKVMAIIGPQRSSQADFVVDIGNKAHVPILSMATTPSLAPIENRYFIRVSQNSSSQAQPIAALIKSFPWREVVFIYQDGDFGSGFIPYLSEALLNVGVHIKHRIVISPFASDGVISEELHKLKKNQTRVFVVHLLPKLGSRFFKKVNQEGMMQKGYAWIITDVLTCLLHTLDDTDKDSMQGVLGVKPYINRRSIDLQNFEKRLKGREGREIKLDMFGLWSYDATYALAMALERAATNSANYTFEKQNKPPPVTDLDAIGTSKHGSRLLTEIQNTRLKGLSGDFSIVDGQLQSSDYQLVNIIEGEEKQVSLLTQSKGYKNDIGGIIWPGRTKEAPKGWEIPATKEQKLRIGFPSEGGFVDFIQKGENGTSKPTGFCVDVFEAVMERVPDAPPYDYIPSGHLSGEGSGSYDDLVYGIVKENYDVVIGDVTIRANRSKYVDFTLPYTESGISMIVPIKVDDRKNAWIFMRPLEKKLWWTTFAFFIYTGAVVWVLEHRVNREFRGRPHKQVGMMFWFSFSTLVFAHKEKMINNLSRFVVIVWIFVVLVLQSSYVASLTSILTLQQLQPDFTDIYDLMRQGDNVGYKNGSYVKQMLEGMGFHNSKLKNYGSLDDYDAALSKGTKNGGVSAIFDELPYMKLFLANHCNKYIMVGPTYKTAGFGFAFPKGSPLVPLVSKAVLQVTEEKLSNISDKWFKQEEYCSETVMKSGRLSLDSFRGLFLIAGLSSTSALIISVFTFLYENREVLLSEVSIQEKLSAIAKAFDEEKDIKTTSGATHVEGPIELDDINNNNNDDDDQEEEEGGVIYDDDQGPPGTPIHETS